MRGAWFGAFVTVLTACGDDGDPNVLAVHPGADVRQLAADDDGVYWEVWKFPEATRLFARTFDDAAAREIATAGDNYESFFRDLEVAGDDVVYLVRSDYQGYWYVRTLPKVGGPIRELYVGEDMLGQRASGLDAEDGQASWATRVAESPQQFSLSRADLGDGVVTVADELTEEVFDTAIDATHTYWAQPDEIWRSDGTSAELFATIAGEATLVLDDTHVYWMDDLGLNKLAKDAPGGEPVELESFTGRAARLLVDDERVYWIDRGGDVDVEHIYAVPLDGIEDGVALLSGTGLYDIAVTEAGLYYTTTTVVDGAVVDGRVILLPREAL